MWSHSNAQCGSTWQNKNGLKKQGQMMLSLKVCCAEEADRVLQIDVAAQDTEVGSEGTSNGPLQTTVVEATAGSPVVEDDRSEVASRSPSASQGNGLGPAPSTSADSQTQPSASAQGGSQCTCWTTCLPLLLAQCSWAWIYGRLDIQLLKLGLRWAPCS